MAKFRDQKNANDLPKPTFVNLTYSETSTDPRYNYTIAGLDELICQVNKENLVSFLNEGMVKLLGGRNKSDIIDTPIEKWDSGVLGDGFLTTLINTARNSDQTVIMENEVQNLPLDRLPRSCSVEICGPIRLRFVCSPIKGRVQVVVQDITQTYWLEKTFSRYLSPYVISQLRSISEEDLFKHERRVVTVLFADLRGFTKYCQEVSAEEVAELVNSFLSIMVDCIEKYDGMVDKFVGDEIMAVFGAPLKCNDHALKALLTAVKMIEAHKGWINKRLSEKKNAPQVGIGLATGDAIIGNVGTHKRMEYTVLGHTVNLAARLCGIAEGLEILTVAETHHSAMKAIKDCNCNYKIPRFQFEPKGKVELKNIFNPTPVYRVIANS